MVNPVKINEADDENLDKTNVEEDRGKLNDPDSEVEDSLKDINELMVEVVSRE